MSADQRSAAFEPFCWLPNSLRLDRGAQFAARMKDLGRGLTICLELIEISELEQEHCENQDKASVGALPDVPLLNRHHTGNLMRLSVTLAKIIADQAEEYVDGANRRESRLSESEGGNV